MSFTKKIIALATLTITIAMLLSGCGNSDGSLSFNKAQIGDLLKTLGTYEGQAQAKQIMGATMTGVWTASFFQDDNGNLKCKCTLRLHDSENGWGNPNTATADLKIYKGATDGLYDLKAEASFSDNEPDWLVTVDGVSLTSDNPVGAVNLGDMDGNQITLNRK